MLIKDRKNRLGQKHDVEEIMSHPWFADLDVDKLLKKEVEPPYIPKIDDSKDLRNFDAEITKQGLKESILPEESIKQIMDNTDAFKDFGPIVRQDMKIRASRPGEQSDDAE
jgi:hypothetical protein